MPKSLKRILYNACDYNGFDQIMDLFFKKFPFIPWRVSNKWSLMECSWKPF
jgi:hypothetical protein